MFAIAVQSADDTVLSVQPVNNGSLEIHLSAGFQNAAAADTARAQLQIQTGALQRALGKPEAASLAAVLTNGRFRSTGTVLTGGWPVTKEFLATLQ
jgi:hypothetical protein